MQVSKTLLLLSFIAGVSGNASLALFTVAEQAFSIFPIIAFILAVTQLYQIYLHQDLSEDSPLTSVAAFLLGALAYSAMLRTQFPEIGSNLLVLILCLAIGLWLMFRLGGFKR
ncbi:MULTISPECIES: DUF1422 family protein [unclassified Agarivorans]|uniref:DUF1422 family protein n=1 Tax=unclassified Agarivorans TaxID=2636026 RepID=UPI003D7D35D4